MKVNMSVLFFIVSPDNRDSSFDPCCSVLALPLTKLLDPRNYLVHNINDRLWNNKIMCYIEVRKATRWTIRHGLMLLWLKDLMIVTEKLQFIDLTFRHSCVVPSSGVEARNEGNRQKCWNIGSMNWNFLVTIITSLNQSSIKPCLIIMFVSVKCYWREHFLTPIIREVNLSQELSWKYLPV